MLDEEGSAETMEGEEKELTPGVKQGIPPEIMGELAKEEETTTQSSIQKGTLKVKSEDVLLTYVPGGIAISIDREARVDTPTAPSAVGT